MNYETLGCYDNTVHNKNKDYLYLAMNIRMNEIELKGSMLINFILVQGEVNTNIISERACKTGLVCTVSGSRRMVSFFCLYFRSFPRPVITDRAFVAHSLEMVS
jgi:hypothetical protein